MSASRAHWLWSKAQKEYGEFAYAKKLLLGHMPIPSLSIVASLSY